MKIFQKKDKSLMKEKNNSRVSQLHNDPKAVCINFECQLSALAVQAYTNRQDQKKTVE